MNDDQFDAVISAALDDEALAFTPDVEEGLARVRQNESSVGEAIVPLGRQRRSRSRRRRVLLLAAAALLLVGTGAAVADKMLTGEELARDIGLTPHPWPSSGPIHAVAGKVTADGVVLADCSTADEAGAAKDEVVLVAEVGDIFYCVRADTELDAWIIARKLQGDVPTDDEIAYEKKALERIYSQSSETETPSP